MHKIKSAVIHLKSGDGIGVVVGIIERKIHPAMKSMDLGPFIF